MSGCGEVYRRPKYDDFDPSAGSNMYFGSGCLFMNQDVGGVLKTLGEDWVGPRWRRCTLGFSRGLPSLG